MTSLASLGFAAAMLVLAANRPNMTDSREEVARAFFAAAKYQEAIDIYSQLFARYVHPDYIYNIGRCYQNMGDPDKALQSFHEFSRKAKHLDPELRKELDGHIKEMEALKAQRALVSSKLGAAGTVESPETPSGAGPAEGGATDKRMGSNAAPAAAKGDGKEDGRKDGKEDRTTAARQVGAQAKQSPGETIDAYLARLRAAPEKFWRERALEVDENKLAKAVELVKNAKPTDPRLADYQLYIATQFAGKHFTLRLRELQAGSNSAQDSHKVTSGERKLGPEISSTFTSAVEYYLGATKKKDFAKTDEALLGLAVLLQANNMEPRARNVLLQLLRNLPDSKQSESVRNAARTE
jgi:tetratricopeptide (TPR) repeat protein